MRLKSVMAVAAALLSVGLAAPRSAQAFGLDRDPPPAGWHSTRPIEHHVYYPRFHHIYRVTAATDPYAYRPSDRGYYPYYASGYWRPSAEMRNRYRYTHRLPKYYPAWGYPKADYDNAQWHRENHGFHHRWHW